MLASPVRRPGSSGNNGPTIATTASYVDRILVVIAVSLEGSARRLVTVRSALLLTNDLEETVELRLEPPPFSLHSTKQLRVPPCTTYVFL